MMPHLSSRWCSTSKRLPVKHKLEDPKFLVSLVMEESSDVPVPL